MSKLKVLIKSVESRKPISFEYNIPGESSGKRIGNVHAIFTLTDEAGEKSTELHVLQTEVGSVNKGKNQIPKFKSFNILEISKVEILEDESEFEIHKYYNSEWDGYNDSIVKV